jgi:hypothetical protein
MSRALRSLAISVFLVCGVLPTRAGEAPPLERGTAVIDPFALRALDDGFRLNRILRPEVSVELPGTYLPLPLRKSLDDEFDRYVARHKADHPDETIGVGPSFDVQLFDRALLDQPDMRFVLAGIVNRMDRAYVAKANCGEIRLIYRLTQIASSTDGNAEPHRWPMTLNLVFRARGDDAPAGADLGCAEIARRWLEIGNSPLTGQELADRLRRSADSPLYLIRRETLDRAEINLQIAHAPKSPTRDFRTDYLMKVFDYDAKSENFLEAPLENQIDRARLLSDGGFARDFKAWLLEPAHFAELDKGTVLIPERFLVKGAIAPTPAGFAPSELQPAFGLVAGEDGSKNPIFSESDVVGALKRAAEHGIALQNIRSAAGLERRLNDMTCTGCHQTRGIGGFHFPGVDWMVAKPSNSTVVPASPHFFGDQVRRRDILVAFRDGKVPDFSRGFASRPQVRGSTELAGTEYQDGWGAHCYVQHAKAAENDASFRAWTCAEGLACQTVAPATRMGMCFVKGR